MTDFVEMFRHWHAGRSQVQIYDALGIDRKTIRKYVAPAIAEGLAPAPQELFDEQLWRERIRRWFPELIDPSVRALTWEQIAVHRDWIAEQLDVPVTVATIAQRLRDDRRVAVSESTVRRYIATTFAEQHFEEKVTVPRGAVDPGSEAQIDYGKLGMWLDPATGRRVAVWPQPAAQWRSLPDAPTARLMTAYTVLDNKIWIAGGIREGETLQTVETYDTRTQQWQPQPSLPIPLNHAAAATYRGEVVVIGGATDTITQASDKVFAFRDGTWVELASLQHARGAPAAAVVGDKLVVVGGQNDKQLVPQTEVFDGESWASAADMPTPREHLAAVSDGVYVYTVGGRFLSADENTATFERFDPESGNWEKLPDMPTPRGSYGAAYLDDRIVAVGGEEPTRVLATVEIYDIANRQWSTQAPVNTPVHGQAVAAVGSTVYCIGGADRPTHEGPVSTVEALDFT